MLQMLPNGAVLLPNGDAFHVSQRANLIKDLNARIRRDEPVHEVACVVEHGAKLIQGMRLQICNSVDDEIDPDWNANVKVIKDLWHFEARQGA